MRQNTAHGLVCLLTLALGVTGCASLNSRPSSAQNSLLPLGQGATPVYGAVELPFWGNAFLDLQVKAGGPVDLAQLGGDCVGMTSLAPTIRLHSVQASAPLAVWSEASADTSLLIQGPDGQWTCDDVPAGDAAPAVRFESFPPGSYDIWVGSIGAAYLPVNLQFRQGANDEHAVRPLAIAQGRVIGASQNMRPEGGAFAVVLLRRSGPGANVRNQAACNAFAVSTAPLVVGPADGVARIADGRRVHDRPVYWPVTITPTQALVQRAEPCADLLANYDWMRAEAFISRVAQARDESLRRGGPFLAVFPDNSGSVALVDLSRVPQDEFHSWMQWFASEFAQNGDLWTADYYRGAGLRESLRQALGYDLPATLDGVIDLIVPRAQARQP